MCCAGMPVHEHWRQQHCPLAVLPYCRSAAPPAATDKTSSRSPPVQRQLLTCEATAAARPACYMPVTATKLQVVLPCQLHTVICTCTSCGSRNAACCAHSSLLRPQQLRSLPLLCHLLLHLRLRLLLHL